MSGKTPRRVAIVGVGEIVDHPGTVTQGLDPLGLAQAAVARAVENAAARIDVLALCDSIDLMHQVSWRYENTAAQFLARSGIAPRRAVYNVGGGERPVRAAHEAALRIAAGESEVAVVCGAEALSTSQKARRAALQLPWPPRAKAMENPWRIEERLHALSIAHGLAQPTHVYPLYENACTAAWGQSPAEGSAESADLWARYSNVAASNPYAWHGEAVSSRAINTASADNRPIAYPYTKLMVANPIVNMGAALLLMSEDAAQAAGIAADRMIYIAGGAAAVETDDYLQRDTFTHSAAQEAVLKTVAAMHAAEHGFEGLEIYSCFPCVPKMARRTLGIAEDAELTVTGGLSFFGGPMSNYMTHALCAMVRRLREQRGVGLLYGQGDFVTKHHALVLSTLPPQQDLDPDYRVEMVAAQLRGPVPPTRVDAVGDAEIETFTVIFDRSGKPERGVVVARTADGGRTLARVPPADGAALARLMNQNRSPIAAAGWLASAADGLLEWRFL